MSEYQYYEFVAIDRPLTQGEMQQLRSCSSRAIITQFRFVNTYNYSDLRGNPTVWMEKYFDAFLYLANWGTHRLSFRFPATAVPLEVVEPYCQSEAVTARKKGQFTLLDLTSDEEEGGWIDEGEAEDSLTPILPVRNEVMSGDRRALYLAWLMAVQSGDVDDDTLEPDCPPGLAELSASLAAFAEFLRIDPDLVAAAAAGSPKLPPAPSAEHVARWVSGLPETRRKELLVRVALGEGLAVEAELARDIRATTFPTKQNRLPRTAGELIASSERFAEHRQQREREIEAAKRAEKERLEAAARETYLNALANSEPKAWLQVDALIATKQPARYDEAVELLIALRDLGRRQGRELLVTERIRGLAQTHQAKRTLMQRMVTRGLIQPGR